MSMMYCQARVNWHSPEFRQWMQDAVDQCETVEELTELFNGTFDRKYNVYHMIESLRSRMPGMIEQLDVDVQEYENRRGTAKYEVKYEPKHHTYYRAACYDAANPKLLDTPYLEIVATSTPQLMAKTGATRLEVLKAKLEVLENRAYLMEPGRFNSRKYDFSGLNIDAEKQRIAQEIANCQPKKQWIPVKEYAKRCGVAISTIHKWILDGKISKEDYRIVSRTRNRAQIAVKA